MAKRRSAHRKRHFLVAILGLLGGLLLVITAAALAGAGGLWTVGVTQSGTAFGATSNYGQALTWRWVDLTHGRGFSGAAAPFTVCTALAPAERWAAVEEAHRDGQLWLAHDYACTPVAGGGVVLTINDAGEAGGTSGWANGVGVLWTGGGTRRWEFPALNRILVRTRALAYVRAAGTRADLFVERQDWNADAWVDFFDIDPFLDAWLEQQPADNTQIPDGDDLHDFLTALLGV